MPTEILPRHSQTVEVTAPFDKTWAQATVLSRNGNGELTSTTRLASKNDSKFLDVSIEEYTGITRRAKYTHVRLGEEASRELFLLLKKKFDGNL